MVSYEDLTDEQQRAVDALGRNVTLTAGAGTGKTTTLTARYLEMIEQSLRERTDDGTGDSQLLPEHILTTTFTERAANELGESVRTEITERIESLDIEEFDAWRTVADELEQGYIHTLHGFCARLLREHALTIDAVDPGFETLDENETIALIHDTVGVVLEDYENHEATQTLARRFSRSQLHDVLTDLLGERPESLEWADRWADATEEEYISFVESALHPIDPDVAANRLSPPDFVAAVATLREFVENPPDIETGGQTWQRAEGVVDRLDAGFDDGVPSRAKQSTIAELSMHLTKGNGERYAGYTGANTRWGDHPQKVEFDSAFDTLVETLQPEKYAVNVDLEIESNSFPFVQALAELTQIAAAEYEARKDRQNAVDFTDQISFTVDFLQAPENDDIREELREQFEYVMVDEFQDTDPRQWDLIKLLTTSDGETFDAQNVFVVGDVKQSIYRFRNADVTQFRETATTLEQESQDVRNTDTESEDDDQLSTNFRTLPTVLESINELFEAIFDEDGEPYEAAPQSLTAARDDPVDLGTVEYLTVPTDADLREHHCDHYADFATAEPEHDTELEAMALAARLSQILAEPLQVYPEDDETDEDGSESEPAIESVLSARQETDGGYEQPKPRDIEPDDIAILIRSRTHLKKYERALEDADVPYSVASGIGFYETTEITALLNLFRTLADPGDERALYAALRSPLFGLTDDTLAQLKLHDNSLWDALATSEHQELRDAYEYLKEWRHVAGLGDEEPAGFDGSWAAYLTRILEDTGYLVGVSADERPQQAMANVEKFREQLHGWSDDGIRSLTTLVSRIERRIELDGRESEADTTGEGVQILTVHDAKGMEFPFVVVPGIGREFKDDAALGGGKVEFEQIDGQHVVGMKAPSPDDPFEMVDTIARDTIRERRRDEERAEEKRVLYVACTRARDHLLLSGLHESAGETEEQTMTDLVEPDPESASSWRDWVQPELLTEDVCTALDTGTHVRRTYGDGAYTVSLPTPPAEQVRPDPDVDPVVELSPHPPKPDVSFRFSATDLTSLYGEYGELQFDEDTGTIYVEERDDSEISPESRHGEEEPTTGEGEADDRSAEEASVETDGVDARVFGEMVHRLCELRPPDPHWQHLMEQTLVDEGTTATLTPELQNRVSTHAQRGMDYVDEQTTDVDVEHQYDELYVTAEFEYGEISGFIDHLIVTPDAYHIIDYKTGDVTPEELEADAEYYENQMKAYAVALHQQETGRAVRVSLFFTSLEDAWEVEWSPDNVQTIKDMIETEIVYRSEELPPY
ncbi:UvrD-helicase domain-containing protein [Natronococcus jeotgali]|uniref:DNA 3'-5' helicase n=1 Tax=Natronococcus jeotgali DSM 18795 TaxID=1227498 RepID=L9XPJ9_9EURY|nr:UvrD-helicase domain-containing protein [Natronococcus jeotgali]ELY62508.1 putative helicase [Natronococcus jeotgali DSM 18795]